MDVLPTGARGLVLQAGELEGLLGGAGGARSCCWGRVPTSTLPPVPSKDTSLARAGLLIEQHEQDLEPSSSSNGFFKEEDEGQEQEQEQVEEEEVCLAEAAGQDNTGHHLQ